MTSLMIFLAITIIGAIIKAAIPNEGQKLAQKFKDLGNMTDMTKDQIIATVGAPNSISDLNGFHLLQWIKGGYHISIKFTYDGVFAGISHEFLAES